MIMARKKRANGNVYIAPIYRSYIFKDKDPVIDQLRTLAEDFLHEKINPKNLQRIESGGGPKVGTMMAWFFGATKRPTNATIEAAGRSIGFERTWTRRKLK
jgi:hypothetical protein